MGLPACGAATVTVQWNQVAYDVTWSRKPTSTLHCDLCWDTWRFRVPDAVAAAAARSGRMKGRAIPGAPPRSARQ
jgi:hypothetical protein